MHNVPDTTGSILFNIPTYKIFTLYNELFELLLFVFLLFLSILWLINVIIFEVRIYKILLIDQEISSTYWHFGRISTTQWRILKTMHLYLPTKHSEVKLDIIFAFGLILWESITRYSWPLKADYSGISFNSKLTLWLCYTLYFCSHLSVLNNFVLNPKPSPPLKQH